MYISEISMQSVVVIVISSSILCTFPCFLVCSYILKIVMFRQSKSLVVTYILTRLTWLIHTSVLPSNWNPDKFYAPTGLLGQVQMVSKYFWNSSMREPFSFSSFYLLVLRKITNSLTKMILEENRKYFFLPYVLDLIDLLEQTFCPDSKLRVKLMYESVK